MALGKGDMGLLQGPEKTTAGPTTGPAVVTLSPNQHDSDHHNAAGTGRQGENH
jgi:hypothetical protein